MEFLSPLPIILTDTINVGGEIPTQINTTHELVVGQKIIKDNQSGISYEVLFGDYLVNYRKFDFSNLYLPTNLDFLIARFYLNLYIFTPFI